MLDGKPIKTLTHRIICSAFFDDKDETVNHKDGDKLNNNLDNLEWASQKENHDHAKDTGLNNCFSENHHQAKLKNSDIPDIRARLANGEGPTSIAKDYPVGRQAITRINNGAWRRVL
jgi:hypothetical protein